MAAIILIIFPARKKMSGAKLKDVKEKEEHNY